MRKYAVIDGHCDTAVEFFRKGVLFAENDLMVSLKRAEALPGYVQFFAFCPVWVKEAQDKPQFFREARAHFLGEIEKNSSRVRLMKSASDAKAVLENGGCGAFISFEGAEGINCDPGRLEEAYEAGVRMIALTWNIPNALSGTCLTGEGLSAQGKEFARRAQKLGIVLDVSHLSERGFWDLCDIAEKPFVASHSNSAAICPHVRNLTDDQFKALCDLGGTTGLNLYGAFLTENTATYEDVYRHLDHLLSISGGGHVALGGDLDGCSVLPVGFTGVDDYNDLAQYLQGKGLDDGTMSALYNGSLMEVLETCIM